MKENIKISLYLNRDTEEHNTRWNIVERHLKEVFPDIRSIRRFDAYKDMYSVIFHTKTFITRGTTQVVETLAGIVCGVLQVEAVHYQVGNRTPVKVTKKLKEHRASWYTQPEEESDVI